MSYVTVKAGQITQRYRTAQEAVEYLKRVMPYLSDDERTHLDLWANDSSLLNHGEFISVRDWIIRKE